MYCWLDNHKTHEEFTNSTKGRVIIQSTYWQIKSLPINNTKYYIIAKLTYKLASKRVNQCIY